MAETTKKYYTFLNITDGPDGIKNVTTIVTLSKPEMKELQDGKKVFHCVAPISNRDKAIANALGCEITPDNDTVWVDVSFWNERADRAEKFFGGRDKVKVVLCGRLSVRKWKAEDGTERQRVQISANDWTGLPSTNAASAKKEEADVVDEEELY